MKFTRSLSTESGSNLTRVFSPVQSSAGSVLKTVLVLFLFSGNAHALDATESRSNAQLKALYEADQAGRNGLFLLPEGERAAAQKRIFESDPARARQVEKLLGEGEIRTAVDFWRAAFIMQHGETIDEVKLAFSLGTIATTLDPATKKYGWITAASWDRIMRMSKQPQWYGTQFETDQRTGKQVQGPIAAGVVTDAERVKLGVPTLKESQEMLIQINSSQSK